MKLPANLFGVPWPLVGVVLAALLVWGVFYFFEQSIRNDERARAAEQIAAVQTEAAEAVRQEAEAFRSEARSLDRRLNQSLQALESVPDDAEAFDFLIVWARADRSLYDGASG